MGQTNYALSCKDLWWDIVEHGGDPDEDKKKDRKAFIGLRVQEQRYLATLLDDFSRLSTMVPIPHKSQAASVVKEVVQMLETETGNKLQGMRTDRGTEYLNAQLEAFCKEKGVKHETTASYTPEQSGAADGFNRTLLERARAMLFDAQQLKDVWAEAAVTATYIKNRPPVMAEHRHRGSYVLAESQIFQA